MRAWADGSPEPAAWHYTGTNAAAALQGQGSVGVRVYLQPGVTNAPSLVVIDDIAVQDVLPPAPLADFSYDQATYTRDVQFTDASTGQVDTWAWDFGDGATSSEESPMHAYALSGPYTVSLTVTNESGTSTVTRTVDVVDPAPPPEPQIVASDTYGRTESGAWRVADVGGLYSYQGRLSDFNVDGLAGTMLLPAAGASRSALLLSTLAHNVDMTFSVAADKRPAGSPLYAYAVVRRATDGSAYRPKIRIAADGSVFAHAGRYRPTGETSLGTEVRVPDLVQQPGTVLRMRTEVVGSNPTTVRVRVWEDGQLEPDVWHFSATDSTPILQEAGSLGLLAYVAGAWSAGPVTLRFDDLAAITSDPMERVVGETFVGAGDISLCSNDGDEATAKLLDMIPGTVFTTGDNAQANATAEEFANCYDPTWGRHKERIHPGIGNHEYQAAPDAAPYFDYFGDAAGERGQGWYAYDVGTWRVYMLNANCGVVGCTVGSVQEQWLRADLAANPRTCSIAVWHQPRWSSGSQHGSQVSTQPFWQALYDAGAEIVISGHDHDYERFTPMNASGAPDPTTGIRAFVVGTGGVALRTLAPNPLPTTEVRQAAANGLLKLTLGDGAYEWEFIPIAGQTFTDRGSGACH